MKLINREKMTILCKCFLTIAMFFWIPALYFFYQEVKDYEIQPAASRQYNQSCLLFNTYDVHDIWHFLSSFGLFFSFMGIMTIDDDIRDKPRSEISVF